MDDFNTVADLLIKSGGLATAALGLRKLASFAKDVAKDLLIEPEKLKRLKAVEREDKLLQKLDDLQMKKLEAINEIEIKETIDLAIKERFLHQERQKQENIRVAFSDAAKILENNTKPVSEDELSDDFKHRFIEGVQNITDAEIRFLWSKLLAGEIISPGSFSPRTLSFLQTIDSHEAKLFAEFCQFCLSIEPSNQKVLYIQGNEAVLRWLKLGFHFSEYEHLQAIGLIKMGDIIIQNEPFGDFGLPLVQGYLNPIYLKYGEKRFCLKLLNAEEVGRVGGYITTLLGKEVSLLCKSEFNEAFFQQILTLKDMGTNLSFELVS